METRDQRDAQTRAVLLAAARDLIQEDANFSLKTLLTRTGVSRARFRRCFADKAQLLAALTSEDVRTLDQILETAQPAQMEQGLRAAVGSDFAPAPVEAWPERAPPASGESAPLVNDAWLERRLRVFERALGGLEKRQEKTEEELARQLAVIGERLEVLKHQTAMIAAAAPGAPEPMARESFAQEPVAGVQPLLPEISAEEDGWNAEFEKAEAAASPEDEILELVHPEPDLFVDTEAEQGAAPPPEFSEKDINDFVAHARKLAQDAQARAQAAPPERRINLRWLAWSGIVVLTLMLCAGVLIASGTLVQSKPAPVMVTAGVSHRQVAQTGLPRLMALADSGDANAETLLALDYLRGENGVTSDDAAAQRWSKAAAEQGQPMAEYLLGTLYQEDESAAGDAMRWFRAAAEQGNLKAMHNLAIAYAEGQGVDKDPAQAVEWFSRAAEQGYRDSEFDLAVLYERGDGVAQSARAALKWYLIAAARGDGPSAERAAILKKQVDPVEARLAAADAAHFALKPMGYFANAVPEP